MAKRKKEPKASGAVGNPPDWLLPEAQEAWIQIVQTAAPGLLTGADGFTLATFCQLWARFQQAERSVPYAPMAAANMSVMNSLGGRLGLSPSDRARLSILPQAPEKENDVWAQFA